MPRLALIQFLDSSDGPVDPGYGVSGPIFGGRPDNSLPSHGHPSHPITLPQPGQPVQLPVFPYDPTVPGNQLPGSPDNSLPGGRPGRPDNSLPGSQPHPDNSLPIVRVGGKFVVKWLACHGLVLVPDNSLPTPPVTPGNELPETPEPK